MAIATAAALGASALQEPSGATSPAVTQDNIHSTICVVGWTKTVRPPEWQTYEIKRRLLPYGHFAREYALDLCSAECLRPRLAAETAAMHFAEGLRPLICN
jgi:hypothetical protein